MESASLFAAAQLKGQYPSLSKRAAVYLRAECDVFAADLLSRALRERGGAPDSSPLDADDVWAALLNDRKHAFVVDHLRLWQSEAPTLPPGVRLPQPPAGLPPPEPGAESLPRLVWKRVRGAAGLQAMHEALLEPAPHGTVGAPEEVGLVLHDALIH